MSGWVRDNNFNIYLMPFPERLLDMELSPQEASTLNKELRIGEGAVNDTQRKWSTQSLYKPNYLV